MEEKELFNFGDKELNVTSLINNIDANQQSYLDYYSNSIPDSKLFVEKVNYIKEGIKNGSITTDGTGVYHDANGKLSKDDKLMNNALHYVDVIAKEQSKKTRSLTQSEIAAKQENERLRQLEIQRQRAEAEAAQRNVKPDFDPQSDWSVALSFAHSFNQNGQIPYDVLQQLVTVDKNGNPVYTDLHAQLDKNFDKVSEQLQKFNNTDSYVTNINLFKQALKDGDLSPQDRFLGMELGFQNSELDKLNNLIKYKTQPVVEEVIEEQKPESKPEIPIVPQNPLESDDAYEGRLAALKRTDDYYTKVMSSVDFTNFKPSRRLKNDSEEEFKTELKRYIYNWVINTSGDSGLVKKQYYPSGVGYGYSIVPLEEITVESLKYLDPKLYNELGLKYFSKYSASKMYKHFKDLVDKQGKRVEPSTAPVVYRNLTSQHAQGGIIKAKEGVKTPWRLNFDGTMHQMDDIYKLFTNNIQSYDAKQIADTLNKLNSDDYKTLNFEGSDNTLGFKAWNTTFNESGLNNLFGYNDDKADYLGVTTKSRKSFVDYLKGQGAINTGNGKLSWNSETNQWEYANWVDKDAVIEEEKLEVPEGTEGNAEDPGTSSLSLRDLGLKKPVDYNPHGIINSIAGYAVNEFANQEKQKVQKEIPIRLEQIGPEKAFRTAYTYDLEKAKGEAMAEANSIQPLTSDVTAYYKAKNDAINNARSYASKIDTHINDMVHEIAGINSDIAYTNAVSRTSTANTNAENIHNWKVEQLQGEVDLIEARNQSFQNLNKEIKHNVVTDARRRQKQRDAYVSKHVLTGVTTNPSNYIDGWSKHHDLIWYKGQNGQLTTEQEQVEYQQLLSIVNQAASNLLAQYENIKYPGLGTLHTHDVLTESYDPSKHGTTIVAAKGAKIDKKKIGTYINKLK